MSRCDKTSPRSAGDRVVGFRPVVAPLCAALLVAARQVLPSEGGSCRAATTRPRPAGVRVRAATPRVGVGVGACRWNAARLVAARQVLPRRTPGSFNRTPLSAPWWFHVPPCPALTDCQRRRRDIFVEAKPNNISSPVGAASAGNHPANVRTDDAAPDGAWDFFRVGSTKMPPQRG